MNFNKNYITVLKVTIIILVLFSLPYSAFSATNIDSLRNIWNDENQTDSIRLSAIHNMIKYGYLYCNTDSAIYLAQLQYEFAKSINHKIEMSHAINFIGIAYSIKGDYITADKYYDQCLQLRKEIDYKDGIACTLNNIGLILMKQGDYASSLDYHNKSLKISQSIDEKEGIARSLLNIALIYTRADNFEKALENNLNCLKISKELGLKNFVGVCYNNIGNIYLKQEKYTEALEYYTNALNFQKKQKNSLGIATALCNIGAVYHDQKNFDNATKFYRKSLKINSAIESKEREAMLLNNIGMIYRQTNKIDSAIIYNKKALKIAQDVGAVVCERDVLESLYLCYKEINNSTKALKMYELYNVLVDSIESEANRKEVIHQEYKYQYQQRFLSDSLKNIQTIEIANKEKELAALKTKNQRYFFIGFIVVGLVIIGLILKMKSIKVNSEKEYLLKEIDTLKTAAVFYSPSTANNNERRLDRQKIDNQLNNSLNDTDWSVLTELFKSPTINNREISNRISLSFEGVRSSLKKMYRIFNIQNTNENQRIALIVEALKISSDELS